MIRNPAEAPSDDVANSSTADRALVGPRDGEIALVWTLWLTYGAFYFCRTNISAAVPGLKAAAADGGLGLSGNEVGWILASLKIAYGLGQLLNGQLSERFSPRVMLAIGMFGSAALNVLFGLGAGFYFLLFVWATNGFCQSLGWTPCVRVMANWVPVVRRGNAIGIIGTGYQITLGLTHLIASFAAKYLGWQGALYVPAAFLALAGAFMLFFLREAPPNNAAPNETAHPTLAASQAPRLPFAETLYWTLYNPALWLLGLSLGLLNACRYGFFDWGVTHLVETQKVQVSKAGLQFFVIAIGAALGSYFAGWATDKFFGSRRAPVICLLMAALGGLSLMYDYVVQSSALGTALFLVLIGFCIIGPQVLLVGTAPADFAHRGASAAAAGFVNFIGYMGAATGDVVTGYYSAPEHGGWQVAIHIWAGWAFAGAPVTGVLWNATARKIGLLPALAPKLGALAVMGIAAASVTLGEQPLPLRLVAYCGAALLLGCFATRWVAWPAMAAALVGVAAVFLNYVRRNEPVAWHESLAIATFGLASLFALMILVERKDPACA